MESFLISARLVTPLFLIMALGYTLKRIKLIDDAFISKGNSFTYWVLLPSLLFYNIYYADLQSTAYFKLTGFAGLFTLIIFNLLWLIIPKIEKDNRCRGALIQALLRSNFLLFSIPMAAGLYGQKGAGIAAIVNVVVVPMYNVLSVFILEWYSGKEISWRGILRGIATNPLILAALAALILVWTGLRLPYVAEKTIGEISGATLPFAFVLLGASFRFRDVRKYGHRLLLAVGSKLVLIPSIFIPISIWLGFRQEELLVLVVMLAAPTSISSLMMARALNSEGDLTGQIIVFSSLFSILTIFFWVFGLRSGGFL